MGLFDRAGLPSEAYRSLQGAAGGRPRVLAWGTTPSGYAVELADRLAIRSGETWRFIGWHDIDRGSWDASTRLLRWTLLDGREEELELSDPGALPDLFSERVAASIALQRRVDLGRGRAVIIQARRDLGESRSALLWRLSVVGDGRLDETLQRQAEAALLRLRTEYDIA